MRIAHLVSEKSKDPHTKHGCVLVDKTNRIISTGYNGPPQGIDDKKLDLSRPSKYRMTIHAEDNAVVFARCDLRGTTAYVTGLPCPACFRRFVQSGVERVVYGGQDSKCITHEDVQAVHVLHELSGVVLEQKCN